MEKEIYLYPYSAAEARTRNELALWRASYQANEECARDIEEHIRTHFDGAHLDDSMLQPLLDKWGYKRINFVLANTLQELSYDGRFSRKNQEWAKATFIPQDGNCKSRSDYLETAAQFYAGYLSGEEATAYLPPALVAAMRGTVQDSENRIARLLFKLAVEINMMMNVLAAGMEISDEDLRQLRARAVREVKQTNGRINFKDAIDYQRGEE